MGGEFLKTDHEDPNTKERLTAKHSCLRTPALWAYGNLRELTVSIILHSVGQQSLRKSRAQSAGYRLPRTWCAEQPEVLRQCQSDHCKVLQAAGNIQASYLQYCRAHGLWKITPKLRPSGGKVLTRAKQQKQQCARRCGCGKLREKGGVVPASFFSFSFSGNEFALLDWATGKLFASVWVSSSPNAKAATACLTNWNNSWWT